METNETGDRHSSKISELISRIEALESEAKWREASTLCDEVIKLIEEDTQRNYNGNRANLPKWEKEQAIHCWIEYYHCRLQITKIPTPEIWEYDSSKRVGRWVKELENQIHSYHFDNKRIWNILQCNYDQWGEGRRNAGLKYEADELQYHTLRTRTKWMRARLVLRNRGDTVMAYQIGKTKWMQARLVILDKFKNAWQWVLNLFDFIRVAVEWLLFWVGKGLFLPFIVFVIFPIILVSFIFYFSKCIVVTDISTQPEGFLRWVFSLCYSVFVFTGSEAGPVTACSNNPFVIGAMAFEAIFGLVFMVFIIGYLVNRLSSR